MTTSVAPLDKSQAVGKSTNKPFTLCLCRAEVGRDRSPETTKLKEEMNSHNSPFQNVSWHVNDHIYTYIHIYKYKHKIVYID